MFIDIYPSSLTLFLLAFFTLSVIAGEQDHAQAADNAASKKIAELEEKEKIDKAETAALKAETEKITATSELFKAQLGSITNSGIAGEAKIDDKAGKAEAMLLGTVALNEIADKFAVQIKLDIPDGETLLLFPSSETFEFTELCVFNASYNLLEQQTAPLPVVRDFRSISPVTAIGVGADVVKNLLSLFKTDYSFSGVDISLTDDMLLSALANSLRHQYPRSVTVELPKVYNPKICEISCSLIAKLDNLTKWANEPESEKSKGAKALITLISTIDTVKKSTMFAEIVRQNALQEKIMQPKTYIVLLQPSKLSGSLYTKKNLWSSLGSNPFYVMGGAVASYTVLESISGKVVSSMLLPVHGGYHSVSDIQRIVNGEKK